MKNSKKVNFKSNSPTLSSFENQLNTPLSINDNFARNFGAYSAKTRA
ncbi:MAG: hypothetical protein HC817_00705 [Saprospiraceae bacterium]|nr:hypothetical protein [Saprospiraceae bacterium]